MLVIVVDFGIWCNALCSIESPYTEPLVWGRRANIPIPGNSHDRLVVVWPWPYLPIVTHFRLDGTSSQ